MQNDRVLTYLRYTQLEGHLEGLRRDSKKLKSLVTKYEKIHDEGAGRRLLFTLKESGGLTDLRRRIGLHEQMLQIWYMTLVYGSLRRLEGGQEDILRAIEAIKNWSPRKVHKVRESLHKGDMKPLERELSKCGLGPQAVDAALRTAVDYVDAPPREKVRMESHARSSTAMRPETSSFRPTSHSQSPFDDFYHDLHPPPLPKLHKHHRKASNSQKSPHFPSWTYKGDADDMTEDSSDDERGKFPGQSGRKNERLARDRDAAETLQKEEEAFKKQRENASKRHNAVNLRVDIGRQRSSSQTTSPNPAIKLLEVPITAPRHHRPASYHDPSDGYERRSSDVGSRHNQSQYITITRTPQRHRSLSREIQYPANRDYSAHSYTRRRSSSRE